MQDKFINLNLFWYKTSLQYSELLIIFSNAFVSPNKQTINFNELKSNISLIL
jgi:hypothetical protein